MGCGTWTTKDWDSYTTTRGFQALHQQVNYIKIQL